MAGAYVAAPPADLFATLRQIDGGRAWRLLPDRLLLLPLAYNRLQYEKLVRSHRKFALDIFAAPSSTAGGCPI
ncbi:hypothetical protein [Nocardia arthritidis]|uniref:hypothetical protein n=1 Tax=Nocardia arthritidis TaxID=228602 RepID=UPI0007A47210